jgi:hypothetical protein
MEPICAVCKKEVRPEDIFCPHCGAKLIQTNAPLSTGQKIKIYVVTVLLAPLGIYWFFKYFRNTDPQKRHVAYAVLWITLIMLALIAGSTVYIMDFYTKYLNTYTQDLSIYDI